MNQPFILLIENDYDDAALAMRVLKKYRIANGLQTVRDAEAALQRLQEFLEKKPGAILTDLPEVVLLDFNQPRMHPKEAAERLRGLPGLDQVPIILTCKSPEDERQVKQWGLPRLIGMSKPIGFFKLLEGIQKTEMHWLIFSAKP